MINKFSIMPLVSALICSPLANAGAMGESGMSSFSGFIALEGGYTITTIDNYNFAVSGLDGFEFSSIRKTQHYTGRLAAGMLNMMDEEFAMTSELGWGYYGRSTLNPPNLDFGEFTLQHTVTGFDALLGIAYVQPNFNLSLKGGAMIQNLTRKTTATANFAGVGALGVDTFVSKTNQTAALPEIKLGAAYSFDNNWSLTAAYMFVLGSRNRTSGTINPDGSVTFTSNNLNPTLNSLLLGIQYTC